MKALYLLAFGIMVGSGCFGNGKGDAPPKPSHSTSPTNNSHFVPAVPEPGAFASFLIGGSIIVAAVRKRK